MNIVITGHHWAVTAALESIVRAFRLLGHNVISAGGYNGVSMPWHGCNIVNQKYEFRPDIILPSTQEIPIAFVEHKLSFIPDLWIDVNAGQWLSGKPKNGIRTTFLTDPHVLSGIYKNIVHNYQYIFNPQKSYWLNMPNEHYVPYAADSGWYHPLQGVEKTIDVSLIGNIYQNRILLFNELDNRRYATQFGLGLAKDDANLVYNKSKIGVNWSSLLDITARVFELPATGVIPVINRVPYLTDFFVENEDYIGFSDLTEVINKISDIVYNYDNYKQIGINAYNKMLTGKHFWTDRAKQILEIINNEPIT